MAIYFHHFKATTAALIIAGVTAAIATPSIAASADDPKVAISSAQVPVPKLQKTIDLSGISALVTVRKMTFSPDGHYLAIVVDPDWGKTDVVVWDMVLDKQQSHIHCTYNYGVLEDHDLLWSRDGRVISFGAKRQWDPMTGADLPDNPAIGRGARLNKDGTKMLTIVGPIGEPSTIHIYDTSTWALQKIYVDGLIVSTAAWTAKDKILVGVKVSRETFGKTIEAYAIAHWEDAALRLLDPSGKEATKAIWFPAIKTDDLKDPFTYAFPIASTAKTNFTTNQIFLGAGKIINGDTLSIQPYHADNEKDKAPGAFGMGFSPNGQLLYLKGASFKYGGFLPIKNSIVDATSGKLLHQFSGALDHEGGLAMSPTGAHLALGDGHTVLVFSLQ